MKTEFDFNMLYNRLRRYCNDEDIVWGAIASVWLRCDTDDYTLAQQITYMNEHCLNEIKNEWRRRRKKTLFSSLATDEDCNNFIDVIEYQHFQEADGDVDLIKRAIGDLDTHLVKPTTIIMHHLLSSNCKNYGITENSITIMLSRCNYTPVGISIRECARQIEKHLKETFSQNR